MKIAALTDIPEYGYSLQYQLPADFLRMDEIRDGTLLPMWHWHLSAGIDPLWQIEGRKILTNIEAPLHLRYGAKIADPSQWDSTFVEAFACMLAAEMCESITQSSTKKQSALQDFDTAIKAARASSAIERPPQQQRETSWFTARL